MKKQLIIPGLLIAFLSFAVACGDGESIDGEGTDTVETASVEITIKGNVAKTVAIIGIEGMTCQMGCTKSIKAALKGMNGVIACDVQFEDKLATIEYDESLISKDEMISKIQGLSKGQYKVNRVEVEKTVLDEETSEIDQVFEEVTIMEDDEDDASSGSIISFPNIFDTFTRLYSY